VQAFYRALHYWRPESIWLTCEEQKLSSNAKICRIPVVPLEGQVIFCSLHSVDLVFCFVAYNVSNFVWTKENIIGILIAVVYIYVRSIISASHIPLLPTVFTELHVTVPLLQSTRLPVPGLQTRPRTMLDLKKNSSPRLFHIEKSTAPSAAGRKPLLSGAWLAGVYDCKCKEIIT